MLKNLFSKALDFIYPTKCALCDKEIIKREEFLCPRCKNNLKVDGKITYLEAIQDKKVKCLSAFKYLGDIKSAIWRFKFRGYKHYCEFFASIMASEIKKSFNDVSFDYISFVPLRNERKRNRGYNQSECIASVISRIMNLPCEDVLVKIKSNHVQHELDLESRKENVKGVYGARDKASIEGKTISKKNFYALTKRITACYYVIAKQNGLTFNTCFILSAINTFNIFFSAFKVKFMLNMVTFYFN